MLVYLVFSVVVMVLVDWFGFLCLLNGFSGVNMMLLFGLLVKLLIDRLGKVIEFVMLGCVRVILDICLIIVLVWFRLVVLGNWVKVIRYCLFCCGMKLVGVLEKLK